MTDSIDQFTTQLTEKIQQFSPKPKIHNVGNVIEAGDGIAQVKGLRGVRSQELVQFQN